MKLPRDVSADCLIKALKNLGYEVVRQRGSHIKLRHPGPPPHVVSVPNHDQLKKGTLHAILSEVALMRSLSIDGVRESL
jgi:predicted RNA binding protein YcfA (HicA-like mRNA interferase family)